MSKTQIVLIAATIILLVIGLWPAALLPIGGIIAITLHKNEEAKKAEKQEVEEIKKKIQELEKKDERLHKLSNNEYESNPDNL